MGGGRRWSRAFGKRAAQLLASSLWLLTLLSILEWSVVPVRASAFPTVGLDSASALVATPSEASSAPAVHALPGSSAALLEKRQPTVGNSGKSGADKTPILVPTTPLLGEAVPGSAPIQELWIVSGGPVLGVVGARAPPLRT